MVKDFADIDGKKQDGKYIVSTIDNKLKMEFNISDPYLFISIKGLVENKDLHIDFIKNLKKYNIKGSKGSKALKIRKNKKQIKILKNTLKNNIYSYAVSIKKT